MGSVAYAQPALHLTQRQSIADRCETFLESHPSNREVMRKLGSSGDAFDHTRIINFSQAHGFGCTSRCRSGFKNINAPLHRGEYFVAK